jgi:hypothetical protein
MKRFVALVALLLVGCVPNFAHRTHVTGNVYGKVVDARGRPVPGAKVTAIYYSAWTQLIPPTPNGFPSGKTVSRSDGTFILITSKPVEEMWASGHGMFGGLHPVAQSGNIIRLAPLTPQP